MALFREFDADAQQTAYRTAARDRLAADGPLAAARDRWASFVRTSHGDVFAALEAEDPVDRAFVETCYVDFLLDCLLDAVEGETDVSIRNREPGTNTGATGVALGDLHDRVLPPEQGRERVTSAVDEGSLRRLSAARLRDLYTDVVSRDVRLALGEYYTPRGVADLAVEALPASVADASVLDPGCGSGVFLTAALDRQRAAWTGSADDLLDTAVASVVGIDLNPVAVKSATLAYCTALFDELEATDRDRFAVPVFLTDALGLTRSDEVEFRGRSLDLAFDALVGNPPWIPWERLSERLKDRWRDQYVEPLGLQPHEGVAARLGHSNDDVSVPFAWTCVHRYLRSGGAAAFVLKRDLMRGPAGAVLRRLQVGDRSLALADVQDLSALDPFPAVGANAAVYAFEADAEPSFPVPATVRTPDDDTADFGSGAAVRTSTASTATELVPLDPDDATTPWLRADAERAALGNCSHEIRHGLKDDANDVFGLSRDELDGLEHDLVYPYLKSRHVRKWGLTGHDLRLIPQEQAGEDNEAWLREEHPETYDYLAANREQLTDRSSSWLDRGPFYSVFGLGTYTWADYKVAWCRLGFKPHFTVVSTRADPDLGEKQVIPGDHYMFVATDDRRTAHFLCALLNAAPYQRTLRDLSSNGKASLSKSVVSELDLPEPADCPHSDRLADLSVAAHDRVAAGDGSPDDDPELSAIEIEIDRLVEEWLAGDGAVVSPEVPGE
ncbi:N-6 DNA methylase [Halorientalis pallida]|uniref:site-specific DNA-methyltransferase (adenine-specific) n=1 Tax=Halorientalis pallida TaxID=2479928 RepID=A0A498KZM4_9EURY|nr:N-6 DNA methylase [Halorientalis pallida]RXK51519.1 type I restriction endonuclease subunit M [Halorientalis pallida]